MELQHMDLAEVRNLVKWIDEQQRKGQQEFAALEQQVASQERQQSDTLRRTKELEAETSALKLQIARVSQIDELTDRLRAEFAQLVEQYDDKRIQSEKEMERLRQVEHSAQTRALAEMREELGRVPRLAEEMEHRRAEHERLSNTIAALKNQIPTIETRMDERMRKVAYVEEMQRQDAKRIAELQQIFKQMDTLNAKQLALEDTLRRYDVKLEQLVQTDLERQQNLDRYLEEGKVAEQRRGQDLRDWARELEEHNELMAGYARQWRSFEEQHRSSRAATADLEQFRDSLDKRQSEVAELQRMETDHMKERWAKFLSEAEGRHKQQEMDAEQWDMEQRRYNENYRERLEALQEQANKAAEDIKSLFALQEKYADTFRQLTRIWLEGYESVISQPVTRKVPG
jgi:hypothetical protein